MCIFGRKMMKFPSGPILGHDESKNIAYVLMLPHQYFCKYHRPDRGGVAMRQGIRRQRAPEVERPWGERQGGTCPRGGEAMRQCLRGRGSRRQAGRQPHPTHMIIPNDLPSKNVLPSLAHHLPGHWLLWGILGNPGIPGYFYLRRLLAMLHGKVVL